MYLYEMHQHTNVCSACGAISPEELIPAMKAEGYAGLVITEHFYHGNTGIRRNLLWEDFAAAYEKADQVHFANAYCRKDIGAKALAALK